MITLNDKEISYLGLEKSRQKNLPFSVEIDDRFFEWMKRVNSGISRLTYDSYQTVRILSGNTENVPRKGFSSILKKNYGQNKSRREEVY